jgi:hypothetical protein
MAKLASSNDAALLLLTEPLVGLVMFALEHGIF